LGGLINVKIMLTITKKCRFIHRFQPTNYFLSLDEVKNNAIVKLIGENTSLIFLKMKTHIITVLSIILLALNSCNNSSDLIYDARIQEKEILTPEAKRSPRINGPKVLAVFNRNSEKESVIVVPWVEISEKGRLSVYDVWRQVSIGKMKDEMRVRLSPYGVGVFILE
jgi:hypothetical protein